MISAFGTCCHCMFSPRLCVCVRVRVCVCVFTFYSGK